MRVSFFLLHPRFLISFSCFYASGNLYTIVLLLSTPSKSEPNLIFAKPQAAVCTIRTRTDSTKQYRHQPRHQTTYCTAGTRCCYPLLLVLQTRPLRETVCRLQSLIRLTQDKSFSLTSELSE